MGSIDKKFQFKIQQFQSEEELHGNIEQWFSRYNMGYFFKKIAFKYIPRTIYQITTAFKTSVIQYVILKRFPTLFAQTDTAYTVSLSERIKGEYNGLNFKMMMNNDAYFYYVCVFMTKVVGEYLSEVFIDIQIDKNLQSEIYIILVYVMIGLQVTTKNYQINHKKVINERRAHANSNGTVKSSFSLSKLQSLQLLNLEKVSSQKIYKEKKRVKQQRHVTKMIEKEQASTIDQFRDVLKQNLYVKVLPKIPKKKIKAWEFDYFSDKAEAQRQGDQKKFIFTREQPLLLKPSQETILSHQTSTSYEYFMQKNHQSTNFMHKNTKISYRPQYMMNLKSKHRESICSNKQNDSIKKQQHNGPNNRNWNQIISQIKSNILPTNKLSSSGSLQDLFQSQKLSKVNSHKRSETDQLDRPQGASREIITKQTGLLVSNFLGFNTITLTPPQTTPNKELKPKQKSILTFLRKQKHSFVQQCGIRGLVSNYSTFNLNGPSVRPSFKMA